MNPQTLPVKVFSEFNKNEITNRMECLINKIPEPCIYYCDTITRMNPSFTYKNTNACYAKN